MQFVKLDDGRIGLLIVSAEFDDDDRLNPVSNFTILACIIVVVLFL